MGVDKESRRKRKVEAEKDCGPVDCMKLQYIFSYNLRKKQTLEEIKTTSDTCTEGGQI